MEDLLTPMYVVTEEGAQILEDLRLFLDFDIITVKEYERRVLEVRIAYKVESDIPCYGCRVHNTSWQMLDLEDAPRWNFLCNQCAPYEAAWEWRAENGLPLIMEPIEGGVYDPDIRVVTEAVRNR